MHRVARAISGRKAAAVFWLSLLLIEPKKLIATEFALPPDTALSLGGGWDFYPHSLLTGFDLSLLENDPEAAKQRVEVKVPSDWNSYPLPGERGQRMGAFGTGTFTTWLKGLKVGELYAVRLNFAGSAHRIYVGDSAEPLCGAGKVAQNADESIPDYRHVFCRFRANAEMMRLVVQVANFWHAAGGLRDAPVAGSEQVVWRNYLIISTFIFGFIAFLLAALSLLLFGYFTHKSDRRNLFMAGFALILVLHAANLQVRLGRELLEAYGFFLQARVNMFILPAGIAMLIAYIAAWRPGSPSSRTAYRLSAVLGALAFSFLALPFDWLMRLYEINLRLTLVLALFVFAYMVYTFWRGGDRKWELLAGITVMPVAAGFAILRTLHIVEVPAVELYGFLVLIGTETSRGVVEMNRVYRAQRQLLRQNKAELDRLSLFIEREHLRKITKNWTESLAPGKYYETDACIMFIRVEPQNAQNLSQEFILDLYMSFAEEISNYVSQMKGIVERISVGRYILSFNDDPAIALKLAVQLRQQVRLWGESLGQYLIFRCGVHYGPVVWGLYGSPERWAGGYIGDTVNTAARLETLCARYRTSILLTQDAYFQSAHFDEYLTRMLEPVKLKGKNEHVFVYEVLSGLPEERVERIRQTLPAFGRALQAFLNRDFGRAIEYLETVLAQNPEDHAAKLYLERARRLQQAAPDEEWNPIEALTRK
ncbi:MAG: adenylate/guanylate cyclase domain-containing protein [Turneriella sp.]